MGSDPKFLTFIKMRGLFTRVISWLIGCHEQAIDAATVQNPDFFPQKVIFLYGTLKSSLFFRRSKCFLANTKSHVLQSCPKVFIRFLCPSLINLQEKNLQNKKDIRWHFLKPVALMWEKTTWTHIQKIRASEKGLQPMKVIIFPHCQPFALIWSWFFVPVSLYNRFSKRMKQKAETCYVTSSRKSLVATSLK